MHAFLMVITYDLLENRRIDDVIIKTLFSSLLYKTNRFQVAVRLFSNRSQRTSTWNRTSANWNLFVNLKENYYIEKYHKVCKYHLFVFNN